MSVKKIYTVQIDVPIQMTQYTFGWTLSHTIKFAHKHTNLENNFF